MVENRQMRLTAIIGQNPVEQYDEPAGWRILIKFYGCADVGPRSVKVFSPGQTVSMDECMVASPGLGGCSGQIVQKSAIWITNPKG